MAHYVDMSCCYLLKRLLTYSNTVKDNDLMLLLCAYPTATTIYLRDTFRWYNGIQLHLFNIQQYQIHTTPSICNCIFHTTKERSKNNKDKLCKVVYTQAHYTN